MDRNATKLAFAEFLSKGNLRADQIRFIDTIVDHFRLNEILDKGILAEQPFTYIDQDGIFGVFDTDEDQAKIISIVEGMNRNAEVGYGEFSIVNY